MADSTKPSLWSTLPDYVKEVTYDYEGHVFQKMISRSYIPDIMNFQVRPDDIFLITFPKSGTTWVQHIVCLILEDGTTSSVQNHLFQKAPFLEMPQSFCKETAEQPPGMYEVAKEKPSPRFMKTQLPMEFLPREIEEKKPKIVYVSRNPKDNAVSYFNFCNLTVNCPQYKVWSEFLHDFTRGAIPRGSWFDNVLSWWSKRDEPNVLFLKYEDLKKDLRASVIQISEFLERPLSEEAIDDIVMKSSFNAMKKNPKVNPDHLVASFKDAIQENRSFLRKGQVGDWKNYFTVAQNDAFDDLYERKMKGTGLTFDFTLD
ncbi:sulfotransferase 1C2-like [Apostichopus japonicus]|uniref:sulfotransferase 1C2-like n=1 Tax=Stichopus japonicus TaxID=307972 RepID=UPI003AB1C0F0